MELMTEEKKGFKKTEVGLIPEDWEVSKLGYITDVKTGPFGSTLHKEDYVDYGTPIITVEHIGGSKITTQNLPTVSEFDYKRLKTYQLKQGDIVFSRVGSIDRNSYVTKKEEGWLFSGRLLRIRVIDDSLSPEYLSYYFDQHAFKERIREVAVGQTMPSLNTQILNNITISSPSTLEEQQAIASALSDVDELIRSLDRLIQKKEAIKKGTMQQLLTGQKRLPGFDGENEKIKTEFGVIPKDWELISLEEATVNGGLIRGPFGGALKKDFFVDRGIKVYEQKNAIYKTVSLGSYYINEDKFRELSRFEIKPDDFIVSCSGTIGKIFRIPKNAPKGVINQALLIIRIDDSSMSLDYFNHYFSWNKFQERIIDNTHGGAMKNLVGMDKFRNTLMPAPATLEEQKAIAQILSDMDRELQTLRQKREKYMQVKQGMMQELLTGKVRLV